MQKEHSTLERWGRSDVECGASSGEDASKMSSVMSCASAENEDASSASTARGRRASTKKLRCPVNAMLLYIVAFDRNPVRERNKNYARISVQSVTSPGIPNRKADGEGFIK